MAVNRCFDTFFPNTFSSDYTNISRQKTVFNEVNDNIIKLGTANPQKKNGFTYNSNFGVRSGGGEDKVGCLAFAKNHQLLLDITKGKTIMKNQNISCPDNINPDQKMDAPVFDAWSGNLYSVNYTEHGVNNIVEFVAGTTPSFRIVDPSHMLFYDSCPLTDQIGYPPQWFSVVDISFNNTNYFIESNRAQLMNGLEYPEKVTFGTRG